MNCNNKNVYNNYGDTVKNKIISLGGFFLAGIINGLFGAGGGMLCVPLLKSGGMDQNKAHANSVAIILPLCALSAAMYFFRGDLNFQKAVPFIPYGIIGALTGSFTLKFISPVWLKRIFAVFMIWAGVRMFL